MSLAERERRPTAPAYLSPVLSGPQVTSVSQSARGWGWAPVLALVVALGVLTVSVGDQAARDGKSWAELLFWLGLLLQLVPVAYRVAMPDVTRQESMMLIVILAIGLYLVKVVHSPTEFTFHDEFLHWRTAHDIQATHHLFAGNPLLPVSPLYPVLEIVTSALSDLSGLSLFSAGLVVIGAARLLVVLALYLLYWEIGRSTQLAGVGAVIYMANPNFLFFSGQFAYESLALAFGLLVLFLVVRRARPWSASRGGLTIAMILAIAVLVATHHLTSYILTGFLLLWTVVDLFVRRRRAHDGVASDVPPIGMSAHGRGARWVMGSPGLAAVLVLGAGLLWLIGVASITVQYLEPHAQNLAMEIIGLIHHFPSTGRHPFQAPTGGVAPLWERGVGIGSAVLLTILLPGGLWLIWQSRWAINRSVMLALAFAAVGYPVSLALRLTASGWEIANRSSEFLFIALGFVIASLVVWALSDRWTRRGPLAFAAFASLIMVGGIVSGWPLEWRMPGPYLPSAGPRSVDAEGKTAAAWAYRYLGPGQRFAGDRVNDLFLGSYGEQDPESTLNGGVDTSWLFFSPQIGPAQQALIRQGKIRYILIDWRLTGHRPIEPQYDGEDWRKEYYFTHPISKSLFAKFQTLPGVGRVYTSGDIQIYDVGVYDRGSALP